VCGARRDAVAIECSRGREYIARNYTVDAFRRELEHILAPPAEKPEERPLNQLRVGLSPLVRSWNKDEGYLISDYRHLRLSAEKSALIESLLGATCGSIKFSHASVMGEISELFRQGVLTLQ